MYYIIAFIRIFVLNAPNSWKLMQAILSVWLQHSWILAKSLSKEATTAGMSAGLQTTASSVESSALANSLFPTSSNISLVYRINRRGPNTLPFGKPEIIGIPLIIFLFHSPFCHYKFSVSYFSYIRRCLFEQCLAHLCLPSTNLAPRSNE